ncbi:MAG: hypothetical protein B6I34_06820 [Anaerolineaceae bacterium 4572_32.1]|nr:MAG: hypothetical protein B6I34_06820 [Anaerolineaceae bacterium 4572_32.1]
MNRTMSYLVIGVAVVLLAIGLIFLCGMAGESANIFRLLVSLFLLGTGGGLAFWGGKSLRRSVTLDPDFWWNGDKHTPSTEKPAMFTSFPV